MARSAACAATSVSPQAFLSDRSHLRRKQGHQPRQPKESPRFPRFGVVGGDFLIVLSDKVPTFLVECFHLAGAEIVLRARDGLYPKFDVLGGKVEVRVEKRDTRSVIRTPGEDAVLVATELRAMNPALVLESRANWFPHNLRFHNANGIEGRVALYLHGVLVLFADDCGLF